MQRILSLLLSIALLINIYSPVKIQAHTVKLHHRIKVHKQIHHKPIHQFKYFNLGQASWYGPYFQGRPTASGIIYNMNANMCAMRYVALHTWVTIKNLKTGKTAKCLVLDRGPYRPYKGPNRIIDLSWAIAYKLNVRLDPVAVYY